MNDSEFFHGQDGKYKIDAPRPFAYGRASVLYKGRDEKGNFICIKLFRNVPRGPSGENLMREFSAELLAQKSLKHSHVLSIIDFGESENPDDGPFLILPFCKAGSLRNLMSQKDFFSLGDALPLLQQVASAVDFAHQSGFIHGDIKPENILFIENFSQAQLADFGMSKYFAIEEKMSTKMVTEGGGTTAYLSPEQIADNKQSPSSDIYAFAILTYELLAGTLPFEISAPAYRQMQAKIEGKLIDPREANPKISDAARSALLQGLNVDRKKRPATAAEFCELLTGAKSQRVKSKRGLVEMWSSLQPAGKVAVITALIAAIAGIMTSIIAIIPELLKK